MTDLNSLIDIARHLKKEKSHLWQHDSEAKGWIDMEGCFNMPLQKMLVPVTVRTMRGHYQDLAAWTSQVYTDEYIEKFLASDPNDADLVEFTRRYVASIAWFNASFNPLVGVMAWYKIPKYVKGS